jgi:hypothetical protein
VYIDWISANTDADASVFLLLITVYFQLGWLVVWWYNEFVAALAATAIEHQLALYTLNLKDFRFISNLTIYQPLTY